MYRAMPMASIFTGALWIAQPAAACRVHLTPERVIAQGYEAGGYERILQVRVVDAAVTGEGAGAFRPWVAVAEVERTVAGSFDGGAIAFGDRHIWSSCDPRFALPKAGERWVVYYRRQTSGPWVSVTAFYPLAIAQEADSALAASRR